MPNIQNNGSPYPIRLTEEFIQNLSCIYSERVLDQIHSLVSILPQNPEIGSSNVRNSLENRYGTNIRKLAVSTFVIVYRFDGIRIDALALIYGPTIR